MKSHSDWDSSSAAEGLRVVDNVAFVSGRSDRNEEGIVNNIGDPAAQTSGVIASLRASLEQQDIQLSDLVKLVVYYVQDNVDEVAFRLHLGQRLGSAVRTAVTFVPVRRLRHAGALVEIEAVAMRDENPRQVAEVDALGDPGVGFCHGLTCGAFTFLSGQCAVSRDGSILYPGDLTSQNRQTIENLQHVLAALSVHTRHIVKVNSWRAPAFDKTAYGIAANDRFHFLAAAGPTVTGITIPRLADVGHQIRLDLWAMDPELPRRHINPSDHWGWKTATSYSHGLQVGRWLFVGGQAALNRECVVQHPTDALAQVAVTRRFIENVLRDAQVDYEIVSVNGMYCTSADSDLDQQMVRSLQNQFRESRPARTLIPVDQLAYVHQAMELDAIGIRLGSEQKC